LKVLHLSALDGQTGAGIAAARIHAGLLARGVDSRFCVAFPSCGLPASFSPEVTLLDRAARIVRGRVDNWILRRHARDYDYVLSTGIVGFDIGRIVARERPDIVQLNWIGGNSFRLGSLSGIRTPVVWRLSDMWPFCGLEHCEPDAELYVEAPRRGAGLLRTRRDGSERVRCRKKAIYRTILELRLVCPSRWLAAETKRSALLGDRPVELIPTSCDTTLFTPKSQSACREVLGMAPDKIVVLVGATSMGTRWKGLDLFFDALAQVATTAADKSGADIQVVTFGKDAFDAPQLNGLVSIEHLGQIRDRRLMSALYNAADVFVAPSRMENLANTVLESLSCGTPVVAFDIGGMPDMIEHKINGFLATPFDTASLAEGINWVIDRRGDGTIRAAARNKVLREFSLDKEIGHYVDLYAKVLAAAK
jgi:glycosyltransferase involved in cell wall biosynthesis